MAIDKFIRTTGSISVSAIVAMAAAWLWPLFAHAESATGVPKTLGQDAPSALCGLVGGMQAKKPAPASELIEESAPVSTGIGYDLGPLLIQGIGVFDAKESYGSLGPALSLHTDTFEFTTGMQLPVTETGPGDQTDFYYAEFRLLF